MLIIPKEQALRRWENLPDNLREALCSEENSNFLWEIGGKEYVSDEKLYIVARIAGYVLMGFLRPGDVAKEIRDATGIDLRIATIIADEVNIKIFTPLQKDIDAIYAPAGALGSGPKTMSIAGPAMLEEIQKPGALPVQIPLGGAGKQAPQPPQLPKSSVPAIPIPAIPQSPGGKIEAQIPLPPRIPSGSPEPQIPKPVILQETTFVEPNKKISDFHVEIPEDKLKGLSNVPRPITLKPAVLELGSLPQAFPENFRNGPVLKTPALNLSRMDAKYGGEFGSAPSTSIPIPGKNRTITEIMPSSRISPGNSEEKTVLPFPPVKWQTPGQIPVVKPADQAKATSSAPIVSIPIPRPPLVPRAVPVGPAGQPPISSSQIPPKKSEGNTPTIIQKNYSEADETQKILSPVPKIPPPPKIL